jgi:tetratricopeptide (TPR) repeat protein
MEGRDRSESRRGRLRSITPAPSSLPWVEEVRLLEKVGDPLALVLWRQLRMIQVWASTAADERAQLFQARRDGDEDRFTAACVAGAGLQEPFAAFAHLRDTPAEVTSEELAAACLQVYTWAEAESYPGAALLFAEAGTLVEPGDPVLANNAGWMCRRLEIDERCATWYHRAFGLAVRVQDHGTAIQAVLRYGGLMQDLGRHDEARRYYERAAARASRTGRRREAATAHHYLLSLTAEAGNLLQAFRHVRIALDLYPLNDRRVPGLAHDWAYLLMRNHLYTPARRILESALEANRIPEVRLMMLGTLARTLAGLRMKHAFEELAEEISDLVEDGEDHADAALVHLAEGATVFGEWPRAEELVTRALAASRPTRESLVRQYATALRQRLACREVPAEEASLPNGDQLQVIARQFERRLRGYRQRIASELYSPQQSPSQISRSA